MVFLEKLLQVSLISICIFMAASLVYARTALTVTVGVDSDFRVAAVGKTSASDRAAIERDGVVFWDMKPQQTGIGEEPPIFHAADEPGDTKTLRKNGATGHDGSRLRIEVHQ